MHVDSRGNCVWRATGEGHALAEARVVSASLFDQMNHHVHPIEAHEMWTRRHHNTTRLPGEQLLPHAHAKASSRKECPEHCVPTAFAWRSAKPTAPAKCAPMINIICRHLQAPRNC